MNGNGNGEEQAESLLKFPDTYHIKAMGRNEGDLLARVRALVAAHAPDLPEGAFACRASRDGNYLSVTCTLMAESREQLDAIYRALSTDEAIILVL
ncbi:MAG: YbeD family protein [Pseudomonadota bacterium]